MRGRNGCVLDLINYLRVLRFRGKGNVLRLHLDWLVKILLVESVILLVILAIGHIEPVIPCAIMKLCIFLAASSREPGSCADRILFETDSVLQRAVR